MGKTTRRDLLQKARRPDRLLRTWWPNRSRRERRGQHAPALWSVWAAAPLVVLAGCLLALLVYRHVHDVAVPVAVPGGRPRVDSLDVIRTTLSILAFVGALLAGLYAYRKQRLAEGDAARADAQQFADRYSKALDQLGSDQAAIRLGGVYAMARLADDWLDQRQTCIDVLCAYLRMPYQPPNHPDHRPGENEVRTTIIRVIAAHLDSSTITRSWSEADFDLTGAHLENADFTGTSFAARASFEGASFVGETWFSRTSFAGGASFGGASFADQAWFNDASFAAAAWFADASFSRYAWFGSALFTDVAGFANASFAKGAGFHSASFASAAWFGHASFAGDASFEGASFANNADFEGASFSGEVSLKGASFVGPVPDALAKANTDPDDV